MKLATHSKLDVIYFRLWSGQPLIKFRIELMDRTEFREILNLGLQRLFNEARQCDELSFLFAILGFNSGEEDVGWQPINETQALIGDLIGLINGPLYDDAKARIALLLYCHITEANFLYHCLYNLLLTIEHQPPKIFSFLDKYKNGVPPSVSAKLLDRTSLFQNDKPLISLSFVEGEGSLTGYDPG